MNKTSKVTDIEKRLDAIKQSHRPNTGDTSPSHQSPFKIIIDLLSGIAVGGFLGYICDSYFGTLPLFLFLMMVFGTIGGVYNIYKDAKNFENGKD